MAGPGSGIASQAAFGDEATWSTAVTVDHFVEFDSESVNFVKGILQGLGLHAGGFFERAARRVVSTKEATGQFTCDHATLGMLLLWKHIMGSAPTGTSVGTGAYKYVFTPGSVEGMGLTYQKGVPQTDGTVQPFTFNGGKILDAEFSVTDQQIAKLVCTLDFQDVTTATALAAASYPAGNEVFNFQQVTACKLGGTASTTSGVVSIAGGVEATTVFTGFSLKQTRSMDTKRYGLGSQGLKKEQLENNYRQITGQLDGEFTSRSEIWDLMQADTGTALQLTFTGNAIGSSGANSTLDIILPLVKFDTADISVAGPDLVKQTVPFKVLDDGTNAVAQVTITSGDAAI